MHAHIVMTASKFGHITSVWCYVKLWTSPHHIKHQSRSECTSLVALCTSAHCCYCTHQYTHVTCKQGKTTYH